MFEEGKRLWEPSASCVKRSNMAHFMDWVERKRGLNFNGDYEALHSWSVKSLDEFWGDCWEYFGVTSSKPYLQVLDSHRMPGAKWFEGSQVNYAEHMLRGGNRNDLAIVHLTETRAVAHTSREELRQAVRIMATNLRALGIGRGDRVVSYMPNVVETAIAFLATVAVGAIWSSAAPEFGVGTVLDRFSQIEPKLVFAADGYQFGGRNFERGAEVKQIVDALPSIEHVVWLPYLDPDTPTPIEGALIWQELMQAQDLGADNFSFERVEHDHPLWIVYSSGTTGLPKPIVHSHVGALIEAYVMMQLHFNLRPGQRLFFYTTTGWIMWNVTIAGLCTGASIVLYDGNPAYPEPGLLWKMTAEQEVTVFGASPTYVKIMEKAGIRPGQEYNLEKLEAVLLSGSPATPETFSWFYRDVKEDLWIASVSGGTDIAGGFVGPAPILPVNAGEIQCRMLGKDIQSWNDAGEPVVDEIGELVCASPLPSMPIYFWGDKDGKRYHDSYFDDFEGVWRHGDFLKITSYGGCYIYGRSDSTLNRYGVRIGTAEIYRAVEQVEGIADSLIVCCELDDANFFMPMFIKLKLDQDLNDAIKHKLRNECSPRHVPDKVYAVDQIPYTLTGKKMEVPIRKILVGWDTDKAANIDAMANPQSLDYFVKFAQDSEDYARPKQSG
jgi:acetoacetyl-CoA synthetase